MSAELDRVLRKLAEKRDAKIEAAIQEYDKAATLIAEAFDEADQTPSVPYGDKVAQVRQWLRGRSEFTTREFAAAFPHFDRNGRSSVLYPFVKAGQLEHVSRGNGLTPGMYRVVSQKAESREAVGAA